MSRYVHPCWKALGIAPTSDQRAIRSAYTAKLKAIDPETDPQAFIALREAFESARGQAQWVDLPDDEDEDWAEDWDDNSEAEVSYSYSPISGAATPAAEAAADDRYRALADFLLPEGERRETPLSDEAERALHTLFDAALADPRLETIAFQADADRWFAEILARSWPASDAVLLRAARRFNWDAGAQPGTYLTPAIDFINARLREAGRYGPVTDPAAGPATGWSAPAPEGNPLAPPRLETPEDKLPDTIPLPEPGPRWEPDSYRVRDPISGEGPRFDGDRDARDQQVPLPGSGAEWQPAASPWGPATAEDADRHARALAELAYAHVDGDTYASADQKAAMLAHWQAIVADPRMQEIAFFADADRWFSELIARCIPFTDPLIIPATRFFGWTRSDGSITQSWAAETITRRYAAIEFMDAVRKPDHPLNGAWRELTTPAGEKSRRGRANPRAVARLLTTVRTHYPDLEGAFDFYRVGLWDGTVERRGSSWTSWIFGVIFVLMVLGRLVGSIADDNRRIDTSGPTVAVADRLVNERVDIDWALGKLFDGKISLARIENANPRLAKELGEQWVKSSGENVARDSFAADVLVVLHQWYWAGVRKGEPSLLADYHRLGIDVARWYQASDPAQCQVFLSSTRLLASAPNMKQDFIDRERALMLRAILETDGAEPGRDGREFSIPGAVVDAAAKRAGQTPAQMQQAMLFKGPDAQQCAGRIAFMETVLALPERQGLPIMREM